MKPHLYSLLKIILLACLISGCDPVQRHKTLSFFFDGVPELEKPKKAETITNPDEKKESAPKPITYEIKNEEGASHHYPYMNHKCESCHVSQFSQKMKGEGSDLCFKCHDNFLTDAPEKHFPAENGMCLECHEPHESKNAKLLKEPRDKICLKCHEMITKDSKFKHPPAAAGMCLACHSPHVSKYPHLLKIAGQTLCTRCHNMEKLSEIAPHGDIGDSECITCHTPHEGEEKLIK